MWWKNYESAHSKTRSKKPVGGLKENSHKMSSTLYSRPCTLTCTIRWILFQSICVPSSPSKWTRAEILSWVRGWPGLSRKPPGPRGPSPCPGEGLPLHLTCSAEELPKMILKWIKMTCYDSKWPASRKAIEKCGQLRDMRSMGLGVRSKIMSTVITLN